MNEKKPSKASAREMVVKVMQCIWQEMIVDLFDEISYADGIPKTRCFEGSSRWLAEHIYTRETHVGEPRKLGY